MTIMIQRICWNEHQWREPSGILAGKENSFPGRNGFGAEEWNFNTSDLVNDKVVGYVKYQPAEHDQDKFEGRHTVYFFAIGPDKRRWLVGAYRGARFLRDAERIAFGKKKTRLGIVQNRFDELRALNLKPEMGWPAVKRELTTSGNLIVDPRDVDVYDPPIALTVEMLEGTDPMQMKRYTPKFVGSEPDLQQAAESPNATQAASASEGLGAQNLVESAYLRTTEAQRIIIERRHNALSNKLHSVLERAGATSIAVERESIDVACVLGGERCLFELKTVYRLSMRHSIREALGQLLEYQFYPGRRRHAHLAVLVDQEPVNEADINWLRQLCAMGLAIELFHFKGTELCSAEITAHPLNEPIRPRPGPHQIRFAVEPGPPKPSRPGSRAAQLTPSSASW